MCNNYENDIDLIMQSDGVADPEGIHTANRAAVPTFVRGFSLWLPTALLFTVLWLVINSVPEFSSRIPSVASRIVTHAVGIGRPRRSSASFPITRTRNSFQPQ
jgi:hypothetical protein